MRRHTALVAALLLVLVACTDDDGPPPTPVEDEQQQDEEEVLPPQGLRVGVVLPSADTGAADEVDRDSLGLDDLAARREADVSEVRALVPDTAAFVPDLATLLAVEGYDLVCVLGRDGEQTVVELASRHAATTFCAAPVGSTADDLPDNVLPVDLAFEELGHVVGVALTAIGGEDPVALLGAGNRTGGEDFRDGLRAGVGGTPLREARGELDELAAELDAAVAAEVAAVAVDAGLDARGLVEGGIGVPLLAPAPLLEEAAGVLRWQVRWDVVLERVLTRHLEDAEGGPGRASGAEPERLGLEAGVFEIHHGPQAGRAVIAAVEEAMGELERNGRDPLEPPADDDAGNGDAGNGDARNGDADAGTDAAGAERPGAARAAPERLAAS